MAHNATPKTTPSLLHPSPPDALPKASLLSYLTLPYLIIDT